jgi:hypothetical protein
VGTTLDPTEVDVIVATDVLSCVAPGDVITVVLKLVMVEQLGGEVDALPPAGDGHDVLRTVAVLVTVVPGSVTVTVFVDRTVFVVVENTVEKRVAHCWAISNPFFPSPSP